MILKNINQKIESKAERMYKLIESDPNLIFNLRKICQMYNFRYKNTI